MRTSKGKRLLICFILLAFTCFHQIPAQTGNPCQKAKVMVNILEELHYDPPLLDDSLSSFLFDEIIQLLDPQGLYFTQESIEKLEAYRYRLDDEISQQACSFPDTLIQSYRHQLHAAEQMVGRLLGTPLQLDKKDTLWIRYGPATYPLDMASLQERWERWLRFHTLQQLAAGGREKSLASLPSLIVAEPQARQLAGRRAVCQIQKPFNAPQGIEGIVSNAFLNALTSYYDPHTHYFSASEKQAFEASLSKETLSYGFDLSTDALGNISIAALTPGGPAWKSRQLYVGDILLSIQLKGEEAMELGCLSLQELYRHLQLTTKPLQLRVRKKDGQVQTVTLLKETLEVEENRISSYTFEGEKK